MRKIRLEMDALAVESFDTAREAAGSGTVHARDLTIGPFDWCESNPCPGPEQTLTYAWERCECVVPEPGQTASCVSCPMDTRPESGC